MKLSTRAIHADKATTPDVSAPIHVSTTFRYPPGYNEFKAAQRGFMPDQPDLPNFHIYSRDTSETRNRLEQVLGALEEAYAITYSSGLSAVFALFQYLQPKTIVMSKEGYHGSHDAIHLYTRNRVVDIQWLEDITTTSLQNLKKDSLVWLESPQNPRGEVADISYFRSNCPPHTVIAVDATFAPPPLQTLLSCGADFVMHSSTKFLGGHSDLLGGVLSTKNEHYYKQLLLDRTHLGSVMGNMEAWLLLRSLRTLTVRVVQQSNNAEFLAKWLSSNSEPCLGIVKRVWHASLPDHPGHEASKRQGSGWSGVLSIDFVSLHHARLICSSLKYFVNATSLGGCESLIEWRAAVDPKISPTLCRLNIGLEDVQDLQDDLRQGFLLVASLAKEYE